MSVAVALRPASSAKHRRLLFRALLAAGMLGLCELLLQAAALLVPPVELALMAPHERRRASQVGIMLPDPVIGFRGNPAFPGHDRLGFNNAETPRHADLVAIGDSQTYGVIGSPDLHRRVPVCATESWPAYLADQAGISAYNMGLGGWGPVEYLHVLDDALALKPRVIVLGLYLGNDLADSFRAVYLRGQYTDLADPSLAQAVAVTEADRPFFDPVTGAFPSRNDDQPRARRIVHGPIRTMLSRHSKLFGLARSIKNVAADGLGWTGEADDWTRAVQWAGARGDRYFAFEGGGFHTVLAPPYRHSAVDPEDPRIQAGLHIALEAIHRCAERCREAGVELVVAVLPTKELVFASLVDDMERFPKYPELVRCEASLRRQIAGELTQHGIASVDTLDALRACFDRGEQPYAVSGDGHPNAIGYRAMASAIAEHLRQSEFLPSE